MDIKTFYTDNEKKRLEEYHKFKTAKQLEIGKWVYNQFATMKSFELFFLGPLLYDKVVGIADELSTKYRQLGLDVVDGIHVDKLLQEKRKKCSF